MGKPNTKMREIKQKSIVFINLDPSKGHKQKGFRPAVVISGDAFHVSGMCFVCPLTTSLKNYMGDILLSPNEINNLPQKSEVLVGQIRSIDQKRISKVLGKISDEELKRIWWGINLLGENF